MRCFQLRNVFLKRGSDVAVKPPAKKYLNKTLTFFSHPSFSPPPVTRCFHIPHTVSRTLLPSLPPSLLYHLIHPQHRATVTPRSHRQGKDSERHLFFVYKKFPEVTSIDCYQSPRQNVHDVPFLILPYSLPFPRESPFLDFSWKQPLLGNLNYDSINMH